MGRLAHLDAQGRAHMVDVSDKPVTRREAIAAGAVRMTGQTLQAITGAALAKGDVLTVAEMAGIQAAKRTSDLIPLCHPLPLTLVEVRCTPDPELPGIRIESRVTCEARTGPEMEALVAVAVTALTIIDMAKSADRWMTVEQVELRAKRGGKSGALTRPAGRAQQPSASPRGSRQRVAGTS